MFRGFGFVEAEAQARLGRQGRAALLEPQLGPEQVGLPSRAQNVLLDHAVGRTGVHVEAGQGADPARVQPLPPDRQLVVGQFLRLAILATPAPIVVQDLLRILAEVNARGTALLLVEQDVQSALELAARGYVLEAGEIRLRGPTAELLGNEEVKRAYLGL